MVYVKSLYSSIENSEAFPTSLVWNPWVLVRVSFFTWELLWGRILTLEQLKRRWWRIPYRCYMCKGDEETTNHSLLHYWKQPCYGFLFILLLRIGWVMHFFVREVLLSWNGSCVKKKRMKALRLAPLCFFWIIWKEKNQKTFENIEKGNRVIKCTFMYIFLEWVRLCIDDSSLSTMDFIDWLSSKWGRGSCFLFSLSFFSHWMPLYTPCIPFLAFY